MKIIPLSAYQSTVVSFLALSIFLQGTVDAKPIDKPVIPCCHALYAPDVLISVAENKGYCLKSARDILEIGTLIAVNGIYVRGKSLPQINRLLSGLPNTSVECTVILNNETKKVSMPRTQSVSSTGNPYESQTVGLPITPKLDSYPGTYRLFSISDSLDNYVSSTPEIASEAAVQTRIKQSNFPFPVIQTINKQLANAVIQFDRMGDLKDANNCLQQLVWSHYFISREFHRSPEPLLLPELMRTGKYELLCAICEQIGKSNESYIRPLPNLYCDALAHRGNVTGAERHFMLEQAKNVQSEEADIVWKSMGDDLERIGEFEAASSLYAKIFDSKTQSLSDLPEQKCDSISEIAKSAYRLANAQDKSGDVRGAIVTAQKMLLEYNSLIPPQEQMTDEQLELRFPRGSDLELQLANFYFEKKEFDTAEKYSQLAINRIDQAVGERNSSLRAPLNLMVSIAKAKNRGADIARYNSRLKNLGASANEHVTTSEDEYSLLQTATKAIEAKELSAAMAAIQSLLDIYRLNEQNRWEKHKYLNLLSALTIQARRLADNGYLTESDNLLDNLAKICKRRTAPNSDNIELIIEKLINHDLRGSTDDVWTNALPSAALYNRDLLPERTVLSNENSNAMQQQELLREQAQAYEFAGDSKRANIIIDHALAYRKTRTSANKNCDELSNKVLAILLLDKARLLAKDGDFVGAQKDANESLKLCARIDSLTYPLVNQRIYDIKRIATFERLERDKFAALARILLDHAKPDVAEQLLEKLQTQLNAKDGQISWIFQGPFEPSAGYQYMVAAYLAEIHNQLGLGQRADVSVKTALEKYGARKPLDLQILAGKIAALNGAHYEAATTYSDAATNGQFSQNSSQPERYQTILLLTSAKEAEQAKDFDKVKLIEIYERTAALAEKNAQLEISLSALKKAYALMNETNKDRAFIKGRIFKIESDLEQVANEKKVAQTATASVTPPVVTKSEQEKREIADAKSRIPHLVELIEIAKKAGSDDAWNYLWQLAGAEVDAKYVDKAIVHLSEAIKLSQGAAERKWLPDWIFFDLTLKISKLGKNQEGEALIREQIEAAARAGGNREELLLERSRLFAYFVFTSRFDDAEKYLPKLLDNSGLAIGSDQSQSPFGQIRGSIVSLTEKNAGKAVQLFREFIRIEKEELPVDHRLIAIMFRELAASEEKCGLLRDAERDFLEAERIQEKYSGVEEARFYDYSLKPILQKLGDKTTLDIIASKLKKPANYVNPGYPSERKDKPISEGASLKDQFAEAKAEYEISKKQAMYSNRSEAALNDVAKYAEQLNLWKQAAEAHVLQCDIFERSSDTGAFFRDAHFMRWEKRVRYYVPAVNAYMRAGMPQQAVEVIKRALKILPDVSAYEFSEMGKAAFLANDKILAGELAMKSQSSLKNESAYNPAFENLSKLQRELGDQKKADEVIKLQTTKKEEEAEMEKETKNFQFSKIRF